MTAANEGEPRNWTLVPERLKRLAKGVAAPAVELWKKILAGLNVGALARGVKVRGRSANQRGFAVLPGANDRPIPLVGLDEERAAKLFLMEIKPSRGGGKQYDKKQ